jgi:hypothetical protein
MQHSGEQDMQHPREQDQRPRRQRLAQDSEYLLHAIDEIHDLEAEKRTQDISTPKFHELAERILAKSREVFRRAYRERDRGNEIDTTDVSIDEVGGPHREH